MKPASVVSHVRELGTAGRRVRQGLFGLLVLAQAAHSVEEYRGRLYEGFAPARAVSAMFSPDLQRGFVIFNLLLVAFGVACYLGPVRRGWAIAPLVVWIWILIELVNGIGHPVWSIAEGGYTPGVITAVAILPIAVLLAVLAATDSWHPRA